jgi:hypothetical protein
MRFFAAKNTFEFASGTLGNGETNNLSISTIDQDIAD